MNPDGAIAAIARDERLRFEWIGRISEQTTRESSGCLLWTGSMMGGYAVAYAMGTRVRVHRLVFALHYGLDALPPGGGNLPPEALVIDHTCCLKSCVSPAHLRAIPNWLNYERGVVEALISQWERSPESVSKPAPAVHDGKLTVLSDRIGERLA